MSLLKQDTTRKKRVGIAIELNKGNNKKYKVKVIYDSKVYAKQSNND